MIKCQVVMDAMDRLAPRCLAEDWDNVGLLIGSPAQDIHKILTCLDVTENIIDRDTKIKTVQLKMLKMLLLLLRDELEREDYIVKETVKEEQKVLVLTKKFIGKSIKVL